MNGNIYFCENCGYLIFSFDQKDKCSVCNNPWNTAKDLTEYQYSHMSLEEKNEYAKNHIPNYNPELFKMREEYELNRRAKINKQFEEAAKKRPPVIKCSYCGSTDTTKISAVSKAVNTGLFGIFGTKRHKQWHCNKCGSDF